MNFPLDIQLKRFTACVIICLCDKWLPQQVALYINIRLSSLHFSLCKDIFNYRDISLISFFNGNLKYLKDTEVIINNILIMMGDFNIHDNFWDSNYPFHSTHSNLLIDIIDSIHLGFLLNYVPTKYLDNNHSSNSVINLMFLRYRLEKLDNHSIHPEWRLISNHTLLMICIPIFEEHIQTKKCSLVKDSYEEKKFINELINYIHEINMSNISDIISFKSSVQTIAHATESLWA